MPNPQVHAAIGMIGALIIIGIVSIFYRNKKMLFAIPVFVLICAMLSLVPDIPELARDFPTVADPIHIDYHQKPAWNTPIFNIFFMHPYLDEIYLEKYDMFGLVLTLITYNLISLIYFYLAVKKFKSKKSILE